MYGPPWLWGCVARSISSMRGGVRSPFVAARLCPRSNQLHGEPMSRTKRNAADGIWHETFDALEAHALQERRKSNRHLHHGEACADADTRAGAKRKIGGPRDELIAPIHESRQVEPLRILPQALVPMNCIDGDEEHGPRRELVPSERLRL